MKKYVCPVCGYVHDGNDHLKNVHSAGVPVQSSLV